MTAKEYLLQIKDLEKAIYNKQVEIYKLECLATSITAPTDREAVQTSGHTDKVGDLSAKIADLQQEIRLEVAEYLKQRQERIKTIEQVKRQNIMQYNILHKCYIGGRSLKAIAVEESYSYDRIKHLHKEALIAVEEFMPKIKVSTP